MFNDAAWFKTLSNVNKKLDKQKAKAYTRYSKINCPLVVATTTARTAKKSSRSN